MDRKRGHTQVKITQREQDLPVQSNEKFHVLAITNDGISTHINSIHAESADRAMKLTEQKYNRQMSGESKDRVFAFHEAIEFKVLKDSTAERFTPERGNSLSRFD